MKTKGRILALALAVCLLLGMTLYIPGPVAVHAESGCNHVHNEACGYGSGAPCEHDHDEDCGEDGEDCAHVHDEDCGYIEAAPCTHEHDGDCGGLADSDNGPTLGEGGPATATQIAAFKETDTAALSGLTATYGGHKLYIQKNTGGESDYTVAMPMNVSNPFNFTLEFSDELDLTKGFERLNNYYHIPDVKAHSLDISIFHSTGDTFRDWNQKDIGVQFKNGNTMYVSFFGSAMIVNTIEGKGTVTYAYDSGKKGDVLTRSVTNFLDPGVALTVQATPDKGYSLSSFVLERAGTPLVKTTSAAAHSISSLDAVVYEARAVFEIDKQDPDTTPTPDPGPSSNGGSGTGSGGATGSGGSSAGGRAARVAFSRDDVAAEHLGGYSWRVDLPVLGFVEASVDGGTLTRGEDYTVRSGSTILTLADSYVNSLRPGSHTLRMEFLSATATIDFTVTPTGSGGGDVGESNAPAQTSVGNDNMNPSTGADPALLPLPNHDPGPGFLRSCGIVLAVLLAILSRWAAVPRETDDAAGR